MVVGLARFLLESHNEDSEGSDHAIRKIWFWMESWKQGTLVSPSPPEHGEAILFMRSESLPSWEVTLHPHLLAQDFVFP